MSNNRIKQNHQIYYRSISTSRFRTEKLLNFIDSIGDEEGKNSIYLSFGRSKKWSDKEEDKNFAPPYPIDDLEGVSTVWMDMQGLLKIDRAYLDPVIPRRDWGDSKYPKPRTFSIGDVVVLNSAKYNQTDSTNGWMVYRAVDVPDEGGCSIEDILTKKECIELGGVWTPSYESSSKPTGRGNAEMIGVYKDGYVWEYLYTIPPDVAKNRCTNELIVVPTPKELEADPVKWGYEDHLTWEVNDYSLIYRLKTTSIRFRAYLDSVYFPQASLPQNEGFRQLSIIINPLVKDNKFEKKQIARNISYLPDELIRNSGEMIYIENRPPIYRSMDQSEEVNITFEL